MHSRIIYIATKEEVEKYGKDYLCQELGNISDEKFSDFADWTRVQNDEEDFQATLEWLGEVLDNQIGSGINYNEENGEFTLESWAKDEFRRNKIKSMQNALEKFEEEEISWFELKQTMEDQNSFRYVVVENGKMDEMRFYYPETIEDMFCYKYCPLKPGQTYKVFGSLDYHH